MTYAIVRDGAVVSNGHASHLEAIGKLHRMVPYSELHAVHEGYAIVPLDVEAFKDVGTTQDGTTVRVEMRLRVANPDQPRETVDHATIEAGTVELSVTYVEYRGNPRPNTATDNIPDSRWVAFGAGVAQALSHVKQTDEVRQLATLAERWHLNAMKAGCAHQDVVWEDSNYGRRPSLKLTAPCPVTGYRYGTAWLAEPLPADVLVQVAEFIESNN